MATFSNADDGKISAIVEATWGTTPTTPAFTRARVTGFGLVSAISKVVSAELNSNAAVSDVFPTSGGVNGDVNLEMTYGALPHLFLEHALRGTFNAYGILKAGVQTKSLSWEQDLLVDTTHFYKYFSGCRVNSFALNLDAGAEAAIAGTLNFMGKTETLAVAAISGSTYVSANTEQPMFMPEVRALTVTGSGLTSVLCFSNFSFTVNNNCRSQQGKCTDTVSYPDLSAKGIGYGRREITLQLAAYFINLELATIFQANTRFSISYIISNGDVGYKVTFPKVKLMEEGTPFEGNNSDVVENVAAQALYDATEATDMIIERIDNLDTDAGVTVTSAVTPTPAGVLATFYKNGATEGSQPVYVSALGTYAIWYDGGNTIITSYADIGEAVPTILFTVAGTTVTATYAAGAGGTGTVIVSAYDPTA